MIKFKNFEGFNWKRCVFRTLLMASLIFTAETVPTFGKILDLIGGSTVTLMAFIMPPAFYFKLCSDRSERWPQRYIDFSNNRNFMIKFDD